MKKYCIERVDFYYLFHGENFEGGQLPKIYEKGHCAQFAGSTTQLNKPGILFKSFWLLGLESRDFSQAENERTAFKAEQIHKMTTVFTQNGPR